MQGYFAHQLFRLHQRELHEQAQHEALVRIAARARRRRTRGARASSRAREPITGSKTAPTGTTGKTGATGKTPYWTPWRRRSV